MMTSLKSAQESHEQQQQIFQQALDKLQGELDAARRENAQSKRFLGYCNSNNCSSGSIKSFQLLHHTIEVLYYIEVA